MAIKVNNTNIDHVVYDNTAMDLVYYKATSSETETSDNLYGARAFKKANAPTKNRQPIVGGGSAVTGHLVWTLKTAQYTKERDNALFFYYKDTLERTFNSVGGGYVEHYKTLHTIGTDIPVIERTDENNSSLDYPYAVAGPITYKIQATNLQADPDYSEYTGTLTFTCTSVLSGLLDSIQVITKGYDIETNNFINSTHILDTNHTIDRNIGKYVNNFDIIADNNSTQVNKYYGVTSKFTLDTAHDMAKDTFNKTDKRAIFSQEYTNLHITSPFVINFDTNASGQAATSIILERKKLGNSLSLHQESGTGNPVTTTAHAKGDATTKKLTFADACPGDMININSIAVPPGYRYDNTSIQVHPHIRSSQFTITPVLMTYTIRLTSTEGILHYHYQRGGDYPGGGAYYGVVTENQSKVLTCYYNDKISLHYYKTDPRANDPISPDITDQVITQDKVYSYYANGRKKYNIIDITYQYSDAEQHYGAKVRQYADLATQRVSQLKYSKGGSSDQILNLPGNFSLPSNQTGYGVYMKYMFGNFYPSKTGATAQKNMTFYALDSDVDVENPSIVPPVITDTYSQTGDTEKHTMTFQNKNKYPLYIGFNSIGIESHNGTTPTSSVACDYAQLDIATVIEILPQSSETIIISSDGPYYDQYNDAVSGIYSGRCCRNKGDNIHGGGG